MANAKAGLADYSSLLGILANSKLQTTNPPSYQLIKGLIDNANQSNVFLNQQFTNAQGDTITLQEGLASAIAAVASLTATVTALVTTVAGITATLADRNNANYGTSSFNSGSQTLTTSVTAVMVLDSDVFGSMRSGSTLVAPVAAQYLVSGSCAFAPNGVGARKVNISTSGGYSIDVVLTLGIGGDNAVESWAVLISLGTGQSVQANLTQDSGGNLAAQGALQMFRVSYT